MKENPLLNLEAFGQSIWMDFIRRGTISGELKQLIEEDERKKGVKYAFSSLLHDTQDSFYRRREQLLWAAEGVRVDQQSQSCEANRPNDSTKFAGKSRQSD